jgi:hypothetical protein
VVHAQRALRQPQIVDAVRQRLLVPFVEVLEAGAARIEQARERR